MTFLKRAWKGEAKLWQIFWAGLLLPQVVGFLIGVITGFYIAGSGTDKSTAQSVVRGALTSLPWVIGMCVYYVLVSIMVWRCSFNVKSGRGWGYAARVVIILFTTIMILNVPMRLGKMHAAEQQMNEGIEPTLNNGMQQ